MIEGKKMRTKIKRFNQLWLVAGAALILVLPLTVQTQDTPNAAETVDNLKLQLIELSANEDSTKLRAQQLDEALKPENIERSLAGVGSTRPEELREQRRRELSTEKATVTAQLEALALQRSRLEAALAQAETNAYHESAKGFAAYQNELIGSPGSIRFLVTVGLLGFLALALVGGVLFKFGFANRISNR